VCKVHTWNLVIRDWRNYDPCFCGIVFPNLIRCFMLPLMARAYSKDLRERAVEYVSKGGNRDDSCKIFRLAKTTLQRWITLSKKTGGDLSPMPMGSRPWKLNHDAVVEYAVINSDATLHEIAEHFSTGKSAIDYILRKYKITRKKNHAVRRARRRKAGSI